MRYMVRKPYRYGDKIYMAGEAMPVPDKEIAKVLQSRGILGGPVRETASVKPPETAMKPKAEPKHLGGGYYLLPSGEKVRGKKAAEEKIKEA